MNNILSPNERKKNARKVKTAWDKMQRGKTNFPKFMKIVIECGVDPDYFSMQEVQKITQFVNDNKHMAGHNYDEGDNSNRDRGFVHNPYTTLKGKFFQFTIKPMIRKAIYGAHAYWLAKYSKDAFVYDDIRLKAVDEFMKAFIDKHMAHAAYKLDFMHKIRNLVCGMAKEDPFYTSFFWAAINAFIREFPNGFEMTESEIYNWEKHHNGDTTDV